MGAGKRSVLFHAFAALFEAKAGQVGGYMVAKTMVHLIGSLTFECGVRNYDVVLGDVKRYQLVDYIV